MSEEKNTGAIADPGPLGLAGFAMTTFILSMINAKLVPASIHATFLTLALFYGGIAQILAGMWEFKKNNTFGATAFTSYGAFWLALASIILFEELNLINFGPDRNIAIGLFLVAWTIFTFYMWIGSLKVNNALVFVFTTLLITYILLDLAEFNIVSSSAPGGLMGLVCAAGAWYTSAAGIINNTFGKVVLPVGPRNVKSAAVRVPTMNLKKKVKA